MNIGKLRARADKLSREALVERSRCTAGLRNAVAILRRRAGSQAGLAISFSLGFMAGMRRPRERLENRGRGGTRAREQLAGALVNSAAKLLVALIANSVALASVRGSTADQEDQPSSGGRASADAASSA